METCWWKIFSIMGRDQLTGGVELTIEDELTGGEWEVGLGRLLTCGGKINGDNQSIVK